MMILALKQRHKCMWFKDFVHPLLFISLYILYPLTCDGGERNTKELNASIYETYAAGQVYTHSILLCKVINKIISLFNLICLFADFALGMV